MMDLLLFAGGFVFGWIVALWANGYIDRNTND